eukprot:763269-Hanusia_phi.AAC.2
MRLGVAGGGEGPSSGRERSALMSSAKNYISPAPGEGNVVQNPLPTSQPRAQAGSSLPQAGSSEERGSVAEGKGSVRQNLSAMYWAKNEGSSARETQTTDEKEKEKVPPSPSLAAHLVTLLVQLEELGRSSMSGREAADELEDLAKKISDGKEFIRKLKEKLKMSEEEEEGSKSNRRSSSAAVAKALEAAQQKQQTLQQRYENLVAVQKIRSRASADFSSRRSEGGGRTSSAGGRPQGGIGVGISQEHNGIQILLMVPDGAAAMSEQLNRGDVILAINDVSVRNKSAQEVLEMLRGEEESTIILRVKASGLRSAVREVKLRRGASLDHLASQVEA